MKTIGFKLPKEEYEVFKKLALAKGISLGEYAKQIVIQHLQSKIREAGVEKILKELLTEFMLQRELLLSIETKLDIKKEQHQDSIKELLEEILEKIEKIQVQPQVQVQVQGQEQELRQSSEDILNILIALKELGIRVLLMSDKRKDFEHIIDNIIMRYK